MSVVSCKYCGNGLDDGILFCPHCGKRQTDGSLPPIVEPTPPMKWYKFLIYFSLFVSALSGLYNAYNLMTGAYLGDVKYLYYNIYNGLKEIDMARGIICIVVAILAIVTRFELAAFKKSAPLTFLCFLGVNILFDTFFMIINIAIFGNDIAFISVSVCISIFTIIDYILELILSKIYFDKRKFMFCN